MLCCCVLRVTSLSRLRHILERRKSVVNFNGQCSCDLLMVAHRDNLQNMSTTLRFSPLHYSSHHYTTVWSLHYSLGTTLQFGQYTMVWPLHYGLVTTLQFGHYTTVWSLHYSFITTLPFGHYTTVSSLHYSFITTLQFDHYTTVWPLHYNTTSYINIAMGPSSRYRMSIGIVSNCINAVFAWFLCNVVYFFVYQTCILIFRCIVSILNCIPFLHRFFGVSNMQSCIFLCIVSVSNVYSFIIIYDTLKYTRANVRKT